MSPWELRTVANAPQELVCFGPKSQAALLTGTRRVVFHVLHEAQGFYRTSGMTTRNILDAMLRASSKYQAFLPAIPEIGDALALARIRRALAQLREMEMVERITVTAARGNGKPDAQRAPRWRLCR